MKVSIIEYGVGNIQSVVNACRRLNHEILVAKTGQVLLRQNPERIILPGVGAIGRANYVIEHLPNTPVTPER